MRRVGVAVLLFAVAAVALVAQDRSARFQSGVDLITVTATVIDSDGHLVTGLPREAFEIFEDGERRRSRSSPASACPSSLAVLLDVSDSMFGQRLVDARSAIERFLFELLDQNDEFSVVAFNHEPAPLTGGRRRRMSCGARWPRCGRSAHGALRCGADPLPMMDTRTKQRASVLIISDGADTASDAALREVRSALMRSDAFVYAIAIDPPAKRAINETVNVAALNEMTGGSGGNTELVHETSGIVAATARIAEELNSQYVLGYHSPRPPRRQLSQHSRARHRSRLSRARPPRLHCGTAEVAWTARLTHCPAETRTPCPWPG